MPHRRLERHHSRGADAALVSVAISPIISKRSASREDSLDGLSEDASESKARAACYRHDAALKRRISAQPPAIFATLRHSSLSAEVP
jgi:hypothetical protein